MNKENKSGEKKGELQFEKPEKVLGITNELKLRSKLNRQIRNLAEKCYSVKPKLYFHTFIKPKTYFLIDMGTIKKSKGQEKGRN